MRRSIHTTGRRLATVLALTVLTILSALPASAEVVPGGGAPVVTANLGPAATTPPVSTGISMTAILVTLAVVAAVTAIAYLAGAARQRRTLAPGV